MIKCLIVDDEPIARGIIEKYILKTPGLSVSGQLDNALDVVQFVKNNQVDLIFLDINMPEMTGIDLLKSLLNPPKVIITTAYSQHGAESYDYDVVDYLLKPIPFERFLKAIQKLEQPNSKESNEEKEHFIFLKEGQTTHKVLINEIRYVQAYGNYLKVHTKTNTLVVRITLQNLLNDLGDYLIQIHKSYLISRQFIQSMNRESVTLDNGECLPISNSFRGNLLTHLE